MTKDAGLARIRAQVVQWRKEPIVMTSTLAAEMLGQLLDIIDEAATAARSDVIDARVLRIAYANAAADVGETHPSFFTVMAAEVARLRSEQGERTPRVDSEIGRDVTVP
jgi:hypothetical protein